MKIQILGAVFSLLLATLAMVGSAAAGEIRLSVAASMTEAFKEITAAYEQKEAGARLLSNFGSSGALAKQIVQGAPADLFISANPRWMDYLVQEKKVPAEGVGVLAGNALVLVGRPGTEVKSLADVAKLSRIALGSPKSAPAGQYAEQALRAAGLYDRMSGRLVMAQDVRQALLYADRGEVDAAFVYRTDALLAKEATILLEVPQGLYDEVKYPAALTAAGAGNPEAVAFFAFLAGEEAAAILTKYGFVVRQEWP